MELLQALYWFSCDVSRFTSSISYEWLFDGANERRVWHNLKERHNRESKRGIEKEREKSESSATDYRTHRIKTTERKKSRLDLLFVELVAVIRTRTKREQSVSEREKTNLDFSLFHFTLTNCAIILISSETKRNYFSFSTSD